MHAVQVDEEHRSAIPVDVGDAVLEPRGDEGQVGVGVARLDPPLLFAQLVPQVQLVVLVVGVGGEDLPEELQKAAEALRAVFQAGAEALFQVAGRGVMGAVERLAVAIDHLVQLAPHLARHVDQVDARLGGELETCLCRGHSGSQGGRGRAEEFYNDWGREGGAVRGSPAERA